MNAPKGGPRPGSGRPPNAPADQTRPRSIRMTDGEWEDARLVGMDAIRAYVTAKAKQLRRKEQTK